MPGNMEKVSSNGSFKPVIILGCGRSGTTIFGAALSIHSKITYLNERRDLWFAAYPEADIWTEHAKLRNGRMILTDADEESTKSVMLRRTFQQQMVAEKKTILVEKLPINNFRVRLINAIFPDARYMHIYRNGLEVARSIAAMSDAGIWFGANKYKWNELEKLARSNPGTAHLPDMCTSYYDQGLLEWRLSTEAVVSFLDMLPADRVYELSYTDLVSDPVKAITLALRFIGLDMQPTARRFCRDSIKRKTSRLDSHSLTDKERQIGGGLLEQSMSETGGCGKAGYSRRLTLTQD